MPHSNVVDLTTDNNENVKLQPIHNSINTLPLSKNIETVSPVSSQQFQSSPVISFSLINTQEFTAKSDQTVNKEIISVLKMVPGVNFDWNMKRWIFPLSTHDMLQVALASCRVAVEPLPRKTIAIAQLQNRKNKELESISSHSEDKLRRSIHERLLNALAPFQRNGVLFVLQNNGRAMIADEMGLGKTIQAIASATLYPANWPVLVIVPSSAKYHWKSELTSWMCPEVLSPEDICVIETGSTSVLPRHKFIIMSYHLLQKIDTLLLNIPFDMIIADESHYLKSGKTMRTRLLLPLLKKVERAILLTGTPALSRPMELFVQLNALAPLCWSNEYEFAKRYCNGKKRKSSGASPSVNASNTGELHAMLSGTIMIRRLKKEILSQLPLKRRVAVRISVSDSAKAARLKGMLELIHKNKIGLRKTRKRKIIENISEANSSNAINGSSQSHDVSASSNGYGIGGEVSNGTTIPTTTNTSFPYQNNDQQQATDPTAGVEARGGRGEEDPSDVSKNILLELFKESGEAKLPAVLTQLDSFLNDRMSGKILVFAHHRVVMDGVESFLKTRSDTASDSAGPDGPSSSQSNGSSRSQPNSSSCTYIRIDGSVAQSERHNRVSKFQNSPECRVAVLAITAAGVAITLTAAATVYFAEMFWTPGSLLQAEDRAHRIGQTSTVKVHYFLGIDTIDDILWPLLQAKMKVLGEVVEGQSDIELVSATDTDANVDPGTRLIGPSDSDSQGGGERERERGDQYAAAGLNDLPDNIEDLIEEMSRDAMGVGEISVPVETTDAVDSDSDSDGDGDGDGGDEGDYQDPSSSGRSRKAGKSSGSRLSKDLQPSDELSTTASSTMTTTASCSAPLVDDDGGDRDDVTTPSTKSIPSPPPASEAMDEDIDMLASLYVEEQRLLELHKASQQSTRINTYATTHTNLLDIRNQAQPQPQRQVTQRNLVVKSVPVPVPVPVSVTAGSSSAPGRIFPKGEIIDLDLDDDDDEMIPRCSIQSIIVQNICTSSSSSNGNSNSSNSNNCSDSGGCSNNNSNISGANFLENFGQDYSLILASNIKSEAAVKDTAASCSVIGGLGDDDDVVFIPSWRQQEQVM